MVTRSAIHVSALAATLFLAATWSASAPAFETPRAVAILVVILYLVFVLGSILFQRTPRPIVWSENLWDADLDNRVTRADSSDHLSIGHEHEADLPRFGDLMLVDEIPGGIMVRFLDIAALNDSIESYGEIRDRLRVLELHQRVVIDFEQVEFRPNAFFLGILIQLQRRLRQRDGDLILSGLSASTLDGFQTSKLGGFFRLASPSVPGRPPTNTWV